MSSIIHMPHDSFAKGALSNIEVAKDLLKPHLPPDLVQRINWDTFQLTNKSFVDDNLAQSHGDLVYKCRLQDQDEEIYIYVLLEHESTPKRLLAFKMLKYNIPLMEQHLAEGNSHLPIILNVCLYAGPQSPYPYSTDIYDCFEQPSLAREKMFKGFGLIDLTILSQEQLATYGTADLMTILLKQTASRKLLTWLKWVNENPELIKILYIRPYGEKGLMYILAIESEDLEGLKKTLKKIDITKTDIIMSAAEKLKREWLEEGMEIGKEKGRGEGMEKGIFTKAIAVAKNMLFKLKLDIDTVQQATELPRAELEKILQGSM
jgi:predicted transposase/invertase (TIGR01784 family)